MATSWNLIFFEGELLDSFLLAVLMPAAILLTRAAGDRAAGWVSVAAGVTLGVFALVRPNGLALLPVAAGWVYWVHLRGPAHGRAWTASALLLMGGLLAVLPAQALHLPAAEREHDEDAEAGRDGRPAPRAGGGHRPLPLRRRCH